MNPETFLSSFEKLMLEVAEDRADAEAMFTSKQVQLADKFETMATELWKLGVNKDTPIEKILTKVDKELATQLKEHWNAYCLEFKTKAHEFLARNSAKQVQMMFSSISLWNAFSLPSWLQYVDTNTSHRFWLERLADSLRDVWLRAGTSETKEAEQKYSTCWTSSSPSSDTLLDWARQVSECMKANIPLVRTQQENERLADEIETQETCIWLSIQNHLSQFKQNVAYIPEPLELKNNQRLFQRFDLTRITSLTKEQALLQLNRPFEERKQVENTELVESYKRWLTLNQKKLWADLELQLSRQVKLSLIHIQEMRKEQLTDISRPTLHKLKLINEQKMQKLKQYEADPSEYEQHLFKLKEVAEEEDYSEWLQSLYEELKAEIDKSKSGWLSGDPWRERAAEVLKRHQSRPCNGYYKMLIEAPLKMANQSFKQEIQPLIKRFADSADEQLQLVKNTVDSLQKHNIRLITVGSSFKLLSSDELNRAQVPIPSPWLTRTIESLELNSFPVQQMIDPSHSNNPKRQRVESGAQKTIEVDRSRSLLKQLQVSATGCTFATLFDFVQRFHLLLLQS